MKIRSLALLVAAAAAFAASSASGQGGPPLVTDDASTVPAGHWEINLAAIGSRVPGHSELTTPDVDLNYGWNQRVQLKLDTPWLVAHEDGAGVKTGLGATDVGARWRFLGQGTGDFSMSTYPQLSFDLAASSSRRGLTDPGYQFLLPVQITMDVGGFGLNGEIAHNFLSHGPGQWIAGLVGEHGCGGGFECLLEVREYAQPGNQQLLLNLGARGPLMENLNLLAAVGRDIGPRTPARLTLLFYLGLQLEI